MCLSCLIIWVFCRGWVRALATTADGKYFVSGADDRTARFWAADSGQQIHELLGHREAISCVGVSFNGQLLITGSMDATVKVCSAVGA